jgi:hypothetical protein
VSTAINDPEKATKILGGGEGRGWRVCMGISMWEMGYLEIMKNLEIAKNKRMF